LQGIRINPIVQLRKHFYQRTNLRLVKTVRRDELFFHYRKVRNFTMSLSEFFLKSMRIVLLTGRNTHV